MACPDSPPASLKGIHHFLKLAVYYDSIDPALSYWIGYRALQKGLTLIQWQEDSAFLITLMDWLKERTDAEYWKKKENLHSAEVIFNKAAAKVHCEKVAEDLFISAETEDRSGQNNTNVVLSLYFAGTLMDVCEVFGELNSEMAQKKEFAILRAGYLHNCLNSGEKPLEPGELKTNQTDGLDFGIPCAILKNLQSNVEMLPRNIRKDRAITLAVPDLLSNQSPQSEPILLYSESSTEQNSPVSVKENSAFKPLAAPNSSNVITFEVDSEVKQSDSMQDSDVTKEATADKAADAEKIPSANDSDLLDQSTVNETTEKVVEKKLIADEFQATKEEIKAPIATADSFDGFDDGLGEYDEDVSVFVEDASSSHGSQNDDDLSVIIEDGPEDSVDEADLMVQEFAFMVTSNDNENLEASMVNNEVELFSDEPFHEPCVVATNTDQEDAHIDLTGALEDLKVIMKKEETTAVQEVPLAKEEIKKAPHSPLTTKPIQTTSPVKGVPALRGSFAFSQAKLGFQPTPIDQVRETGLNEFKCRGIGHGIPIHPLPAQYLWMHPVMVVIGNQPQMFPFSGPMHQSNMGPPPGSIVPRYPFPINFSQAQPSIQAAMPRVVAIETNQQGGLPTNDPNLPIEQDSI